VLIRSIFAQNDILGTGLQAASLRNEVITNNIANQDVLGFKRSVVEFEDHLARAVDNFRNTGSLDLRRAVPRIRRVDDGMSYRVDGNNVDPQREMVLLARNAGKYEGMTNSLMSNYRRINLALSAR
jgi:flagellar basal-body rod protein FlgB